jgi:hypothetical protein
MMQEKSITYTGQPAANPMDYRKQLAKIITKSYKGNEALKSVADNCRLKS